MNISTNSNVGKIASLLNARIIGDPVNEVWVKNISLDSRKLITPASTLFFSINKNKVYELKIINELIEKGVRYFVIDQALQTFHPDCSFLLVDDTLDALQQIATAHRKQFNIPVIGITGSNGKTIVKEWLNQLLHQDFNIVRSPRSYNSQIGVPLSVLQMVPENDLGIFEAGISQPAEMKRLAAIIEPTIGIFTNIGDAHSEGFKNSEQKITEKLLLFSNSSNLIYCKDHDQIDSLVQIILPSVNCLCWSKHSDADLKITNIIRKNNQTMIVAQYEKNTCEISIPFSDDASIENAMNCWCLLLLFGTRQETITERFRQLQPMEMRLELKQGINNCSVINDSYSSDIHSLHVALNFLEQQKQHPTHTVILSDIQQSRKTANELYTEVARQLIEKNIHQFIGIGTHLYAVKDLFSTLPKTHFYKDVSEFKKDFYSLQFNNEAILLKGARVFEFEQIGSMLEQKVHQTTLSINLSAVSHNVRQYKNLLKPDTKIMAMVKAFSYGSGAYEIARVLQFSKIDYLAVAYADEGIALRKAGITLPIMVMNPEEDSYYAIIQYFLEPELFSFHTLHSFESYIESQGLEHYPIHIKLDTGMHRLGFVEAEIADLATILKDNKCLHVQSILSHLIASNDPAKNDLTALQFKKFNNYISILESSINYPFLKHIANSSAISNHPDMQMDMVRVGIGIYGIDSNNKIQNGLMNVMSLTTNIAQIKDVKAGETVGYGGNIILQKDSRIATIRIGYADGYHRVFSNGVGKVLIKNKLAPVIGTVCMDMTMIDITGIEDVVEGENVEVFGNKLRVSQLAEWSGTITYEILTNISQRVNRLYYEE